MTYKPNPGYVPVEPDTGIVHDNGVDIDHTKCGKRLTWCKSIMFVGDDNDWCPTCWPGTEEGTP